MSINIIVAIDENDGIGKDNKLPWHIPEDLKRFKSLTTDNHIIMGRKTYESIGKPLPNRTNIVLNSSLSGTEHGVTWCVSLDQAINYCKSVDHTKDIFIIGGAKVFEAAEKIADKLYITQVLGNFDCDVKFPTFKLTEWACSSHNKTNSRQGTIPAYQFLEFIKL